MKKDEVKETPEIETKEGLVYNNAPDARMSQNWRGNVYGSIEWEIIESICRAADTMGQTEMWAKLTRKMYEDPRIIACTTNRFAPIAGAKVSSKPGGKRDIDILAAKDAKLMLDSIPNMPAVLMHLLDGVMTGYAVAEIIWEIRGEWVWPVSIDFISPDRIRFDDLYRPYLWDNGLLGNDPGRDPSVRLDGRPLAKNKYIVHMPISIPNYPTSSGLLRACMRPWFMKWQGRKYWMNGAEVGGNPRFIGKFPVGASETARREFYDALENMNATNTIAMTEENEVQMLAPTAQGEGGIWSNFSKTADTDITLAILGSDLLTQGGVNGSRALGEAQGEYTIDPRLINDSSALWQTIAEQLVKPFLEFNNFRYNFSNPALPKLESVFVELTPNVDDKLIEAKAATYNELRESRGLPKWPDEIGNKRLGTLDETPKPEKTE